MCTGSSPSRRSASPPNLCSVVYQYSQRLRTAGFSADLLRGSGVSCSCFGGCNRWPSAALVAQGLIKCLGRKRLSTKELQQRVLVVQSPQFGCFVLRLQAL